MSKLITDFAPQQWYLQTAASPSLPADKCIPSNLQSFHDRFRTRLCLAVAACLLAQLLTCASLAMAIENFDLIDARQPACENCAADNSAPHFEQTRVAMNEQYSEAPGMIGSAPEAEAPPAIGDATPVAVESMQPLEGWVQVAQRQGFAEQTQFVGTEYPQSGGLGQSLNEYPIGSQPMDYPFTDDSSISYSQDGFEQGFDSGVQQVSYDSQYPVQDYGQTFYNDGYSQNYVEAPAEYYPSQQIYANYQEMPSVSSQQTYAQTYTSSASSSGNVQSGLAQQKAVQAAQSGVRGHLGGGLGGAKYEGVGWSNHSAQNAINSCCYWGMRPTAQIGVSKGNDGFWYACVLYH